VNRLRGFLRRPTPEELTDVGRLEHLSLTPAEATAYAEVLDGLLGQLDRLDELHPPTPVLRHTDRDPGRRPTADEDPFNAFVRLCRVEGAARGPLAGTRLGVKDNLAVAGVPLTNGSRTAPFTPTTDAVVVERLLDAGCTVVGKLNLDDFSALGTGESSFHAPPRNPHDPRCSAGGSSGGAGSSVASGHVDLALGVDQGGSARIPASFCGVVSHKATHGLVPSYGVTHIDHTIDFICPTARTVAETARATDVMTGIDERDPQWSRWTLAPTKCAAALGTGVAGMRIGVLTEGVDPALVQADVLADLERAKDALREAGAELHEVSVPLWSDAWAIELSMLIHLGWAMAQSEGMGWGHMGAIDEARSHAFALVRRVEADDFPPFLKAWLLAGRWLHDRYHSTLYARGQNLRRALTAEIDRALVDVDLLIMPTTPHVAPRLIDRPAIDTVLLESGTSMTMNTAPTNLSGHPSLAVPTGRDGAGLPTSIQIVGRQLADADTFRAGAVVEAALGTVPVTALTQEAP
jgi:amidase